MSDPTRTYVLDGLTVEWRAGHCTHCERCWREMPAVFDPKARPWVNLAGAPIEEIKKQVELCESEALSLGRSIIAKAHYATKVEAQAAYGRWMATTDWPVRPPLHIWWFFSEAQLHAVAESIDIAALNEFIKNRMST